MRERYRTDKAIVNGIRKRDPEVFNYLREQYYDTVRLMVVRNYGSEEDAEDTFSEGMADLISYLDDPRQKLKRKVSSLFIVICKNRWMDVLDKRMAERRYRQSMDAPVHEQQTGDMIDRALYEDIFWQSFKQLQEECQEIIRKFLEGKRLREIARLLNISDGYIKTKKYFCQKSLIGIINEHPAYAVIKRNEAL